MPSGMGLTFSCVTNVGLQKISRVGKRSSRASLVSTARFDNVSHCKLFLTRIRSPRSWASEPNGIKCVRTRTHEEGGRAVEYREYFLVLYSRLYYGETPRSSCTYYSAPWFMFRWRSLKRDDISVVQAPATIHRGHRNRYVQKTLLSFASTRLDRNLAPHQGRKPEDTQLPRCRRVQCS